jgi:hypothetical protein
MSKAKSINTITKAIHNGFKKAHNQYYKYSGSWLFLAPEYFSTVHIYQELASKIDNELIRLEVKPSDLLEESGKVGSGKVSKRISNGRIDLVLDYATGTRENPKPRGLIEVKKQVYSIDKIIGDLNRFDLIFKRISNHDIQHSIQFGMCCYSVDYTVSKTRDKFKDSISKLKSDLDLWAKDKKYLSVDLNCQQKVEEKGNSWSSVVIVIKRTA